MAASRPSLVSVARQTSPMPLSPNLATMRECARVEGGVIGLSIGNRITSGLAGGTLAPGVGNGLRGTRRGVSRPQGHLSQKRR